VIGNIFSPTTGSSMVSVGIKLSHYTPKALGGKGDIAPTHSRSRHQMGQMGVSGQSHFPAAL
jgi:hypothetical protein